MWLLIICLVGLSALSVQAAEVTPSPPEPTFESVAALNKERRCPDALENAKRLRESLESAGKGGTVDGARALDLVVEASWKCKAATPDTQGLAEKAVAIKKSLLPADDPQVAASLQQLANIYNDRNEFAPALAIYREVLAIREKAFGADSLDIVPTLTNLGLASSKAADYRGAREWYERALAIREKRLPPDHPDLALSLQGVGMALYYLGDYAGAEPYLRRTLAIREQALKPSDPMTIGTVLNIGDVLQKKGDLSDAASFQRRALNLIESDPHHDLSGIANVSGNLAAIYAEMGDYQRALVLQEKNVRSLSGEPPSRPIDLALALNNLGYFLFLAGDYAGAGKPLQQALDLRRKSLPPDHADIADTLTRLADLALKKKDFTEARKDYDEALAIQRRSLGEAHPDTADTLNNMADLREADGDPTGALALYEESLSVLKKALGEDHALVLRVKVNRAAALLELGRREVAESDLRAVLSKQETVLGPFHPDVARTLTVLAGSRLQSGNRNEALSLALRAETIARDLLISTEPALSDRQARAFSGTRTSGNALALSVIAASDPHPEAVKSAWNSVIRSRALVVDAMAARQHVVEASADADIAKLREDLSHARERLSTLALRGPGKTEMGVYRRRLVEARSEKESLERGLGEKSAPFKEETREAHAGYGDVAASLPPGAALVAYVRFDRAAVESRSDPTPTYLAFVQRAGEEAPRVVPLGDAKVIDAAVRRWRHEAGTEPTAIPAAARADEGRYLEAGLALRKSIWDPVMPSLKNASLVLVVADGELQFVSFAALPAAGDRYLVESGPAIHYLSAERDLTRTHASAAAGGLLVVGAPDFDARLGVVVAVKASALESSSASSRRRAATISCGEATPARFESLPGSAAEVESIRSLWNKLGTSRGDVRLLMGPEATAPAFSKNAAGSAVIHLATHGFFLDDACAPEAETLLRSGLVFAGANHRGEIPDDALDDGLLTAEQVASLDLRGVDWVVLSACETGLGDVEAGEGVLGLRRSFRIAGAATLITSLWRVKDDASRDWMTALYNGRLSGLSTAEAVRNASLAMLKSARKVGRSTHPFYWGAFVATGDWR